MDEARPYCRELGRYPGSKFRLGISACFQHRTHRGGFIHVGGTDPSHRAGCAGWRRWSSMRWIAANEICGRLPAVWRVRFNVLFDVLVRHTASGIRLRWRYSILMLHGFFRFWFDIESFEAIFSYSTPSASGWRYLIQIYMEFSRVSSSRRRI
jgi:hypothetical protein